MNTLLNKEKLQRESDSFLTKILARSLSVHITPIIAKTKITPLQVTIYGFILAMGSAFLAIRNSFTFSLAAALLLETSHVLDCVDGELARLTGKGNLFAAALDPISDRCKDIALLFSSFYSAYHDVGFTSSGLFFPLCILSISCWLLYVYIVDAHVNPISLKLSQTGSIPKRTVYIGLYDFFVYGCILFLIFGWFSYFFFYILLISCFGISFQIYKLKVLSSFKL